MPGLVTARSVYHRLVGVMKKEGDMALATVIEARGATPQVPGASALFTKNGLLLGTVGGGIIEADIMKKAVQALKRKSLRPMICEFRLEDDISESQGAICGGALTVLVDPSIRLQVPVFREIRKSLLEGKSGALVTMIKKPLSRDVQLSRFWIRQEDSSGISQAGLTSFEGAIRKSFSRGQAAWIKREADSVPGGRSRIFLFVEPLFPPPRLVIAGAGHVGQAVACLGSFLEFEVIVIDDRPEYANAERFPEASRIVVEDIGRAVGRLARNADTYIVIVTRGHSRDAEALRACIRSGAAYIGMIGSSRKVKLMRKKFLKERWASPEEFDRVFAPVGLKIASRTVEEIAVSIAAQLVLVRNENKAKKSVGGAG